MSNDQINAAIAKACGRERNPDGGWYPDNGLRVGTQAIPDYCTDLNAMHEAEDELSGNQYMVYALMLDAVEGSLFGIRATARQRAEAFLRTLEKWEPVVKHPFTTDGDLFGDANKMVGEPTTEQSSEDLLRDGTKKVGEVQP